MGSASLRRAFFHGPSGRVCNTQSVCFYSVVPAQSTRHVQFCAYVPPPRPAINSCPGCYHRPNNPNRSRATNVICVFFSFSFYLFLFLFLTSHINWSCSILIACIFFFPNRLLVYFSRTQLSPARLSSHRNNRSFDITYPRDSRN